jgi:hypothetical protein
VKSASRTLTLALILILALGALPAFADDSGPGSNTGGATTAAVTSAAQPQESATDAVGITDPAEICDASVYDFAGDAEFSNPTTFPGGTISDGEVRIVGSSWATWNPPSPGKHILYVPDASVDIVFSTPQSGVGVVAEPNPFGVYNITIEAFDSGATSLGSFTLGIDGLAGAAFLGLLSTSADIASVTVSGVVDFAFSDITYGICQLDVDVDVVPGKDTNRINLGRPGLVQVAVLGDEDVDVTTIDPMSMAFGPEGAPALKYWLRDVDGDGDLDLLLLFQVESTGIQCGDTTAPLTGYTYDGLPVVGTGAITTVGCS